ncbi:MAG: glycine--tRNA ligase [Simkaniaceae bacterium]
MHTFQNLISNLTNFWAEKGCIVHQGHDVEVGAGTFNPATFLRSLGPEPYNTVYVEPSRRPQDGRYGDNPNRLQLFHQLQVIMKPSPQNFQSLYLQSLEAAGFDLSKHDIRFVHDDWESPTLGAWGLGWEVWIDGMEITQFTYFQAVANIPLESIPVELAYGLERLSMILQGVDNFFDMKWNEILTYGEVCKRNEKEWSHYNFEFADTSMWLRHFNDFEKEASGLAQKNLPIPAYDFVMKASHAFNMLEARGVLSTTERTGYIARIRNLARQVALAYLESRKEQGYPLIHAASERKNPPNTQKMEDFDPKKTDDFLLEIGSEQLPASFVSIGELELEKKLTELLDDNQIPYGNVEVFATPRRLALLIRDMAHGREDEKIEKKGPPVSIAFDSKGNVTEKGRGFLESIGFAPISLEDIKKKKEPSLFISESKGKDYLYASLMQKGASTVNLLIESLPKLITSIPFPKKMRWGSLDVEYARPLEWIACLLGGQIIEFTVGDVVSSNYSYGHAQRDPEAFLLKHPRLYQESLKSHYVLASPAEREQTILRQLQVLEKETGCEAIKQSKVLQQVLNLTEWPELALGEFSPKFLKAPKEVLISEMVEHQKYFPLQKDADALANLFVITADNAPTDEIIQGNQKVLSARLADGVFLYEQDLKTSLEVFNEKLKQVVFQKDLGSVFEKEKRLAITAEALQKTLNIAKKEFVVAAAQLCKADLASNLVGEFPELQGTAGKYYALAAGKPLEVAIAIEEHYLPRFEYDELPMDPNGIVLALADRIDNLAGYFSVGLKPTSSHDPYALRRQAIGLLKIIIKHEISLDLPKIFEEAFHSFPHLHGKIHEQRELKKELLQFMTARFKAVLHEYYEFKKEEIEATIRQVIQDPYDQFCQLKALDEFRRTSGSFSKLFEVFKRAKGQLENSAAYDLDVSLLKEKEEVKLNETLEQIKPVFHQALDQKDYTKAYELLGSLKDPLADLFDHVKILADDPDLQKNRLALLQKVFSFFSALLDFAKIQG